MVSWAPFPVTVVFVSLVVAKPSSVSNPIGSLLLHAMSVIVANAMSRVARTDKATPKILDGKHVIVLNVATCYDVVLKPRILYCLVVPHYAVF